MKNLLLSAVTNPVKALLDANYIGLLAWGVALGVALRHARESTQEVLLDGADALSKVVHWVIRLAPLGIFGLVAGTLASSGFDALDREAEALPTRASPLPAPPDSVEGDRIELTVPVEVFM